MLLTYLYANFFDENSFLSETKLSAEKLHALISNRTMPSASYTLSNFAGSSSFLGKMAEKKTYRFYLKGYGSWADTVRNLDIENEDMARCYFKTQYKAAQKVFMAGSLGKQIRYLVPNILDEYGQERFSATWDNFLDGVYGVCTRTGLPENIFLKQMTASFIEQFVQIRTPEAISKSERETLRRAVNLLDQVESDFAPDEVQHSSRQRCIIDVREAYFALRAV